MQLHWIALHRLAGTDIDKQTYQAMLICMGRHEAFSVVQKPTKSKSVKDIFHGFRSFPSCPSLYVLSITNMLCVTSPGPHCNDCCSIQPHSSHEESDILRMFKERFVTGLHLRYEFYLQMLLNFFTFEMQYIKRWI